MKKTFRKHLPSKARLNIMDISTERAMHTWGVNLRVTLNIISLGFEYKSGMIHSAATNWVPVDLLKFKRL